MTGLLCGQMLVEPIGEQVHVLAECGPAVVGSGAEDQFARDFVFFQLVDEDVRLLDRDDFVLVAVDDQHWGIVGGDVRDRRNLLSDLFQLRFVSDPLEAFGLRVVLDEIKRCRQPGERAGAERDDARFTPILKVGWREETGDRLHATRLPINGVFHLFVFRLTAGPHHQ